MTLTTRRNHRHRAATCGRFLLTALLLAAMGTPRPAAAERKLRIVGTLPTYADIARRIAGDRGEVQSLAKGYEDPHFVRPKPSLALILEQADVLISTGLDLELWLPGLMDKAANPKIRSGQPGYISVSQGISLLEKPAIVTRSEGGVHVYGNPHIYTGPLNGKIIARNIAIGLKNVDPAGAAVYDRNYRQFAHELDRRLFGDPLLKILGSTLLTKLTLGGKLMAFLNANEYRGKKLIEYLGGWMKQALPLRGAKIVAYHKNWAYFVQVFGVEILDYVEPKPGIPPSPGHVAKVIRTMQQNHVRVLLAGSYYDLAKVRGIASRVGARPVIVGLNVGGEPRMGSFFAQFDIWIADLVAALSAAPRT
jgi:zinc/manganese transport system substrate-binding protein